MSVKDHFLQSHLDYIAKNLHIVSDECEGNGKRKKIECQMVANCCQIWKSEIFSNALERDIFQQHKEDHKSIILIAGNFVLLGKCSIFISVLFSITILFVT
jgi:hypothetical protein